MEFRNLDATASLKAALEERLTTLEKEYINNQSALIVSEAQLSGRTPDAEFKAAMDSLSVNMEEIEKAHAGTIAQIDALDTMLTAPVEEEVSPSKN